MSDCQAKYSPSLADFPRPTSSLPLSFQNLQEHPLWGIFSLPLPPSLLELQQMFAETFAGLKALTDGAVGTGCLARPPICIVYPERCQLGLTDSFVRAL